MAPENFFWLYKQWITQSGATYGMLYKTAHPGKKIGALVVIIADSQPEIFTLTKLKVLVDSENSIFSLPEVHERCVGSLP